MSQLSVAAWGREGHHWQVFKTNIVTYSLVLLNTRWSDTGCKEKQCKMCLYRLFSPGKKKKKHEREASLSYFKLPFPSMDFLGKEL